MKIELVKFGDILVSRPAGREAFLVMSSHLRDVDKKETIVVDFSGIKVLTPSWADEVITKLAENYSVNVENTGNPSVRETLKTLSEYSGLRVK
ncbi:MAG: STAS-like domain-containing protein [Candidatus Berkelbacteria bacterium]|nr:STAS-like domain-containing protein [Candidatus Berkelbacteria bacterium]